MDRYKEIELLSQIILNAENGATDIFKNDSRDGLNIYKQNYLMSLISVLKNKYPVTLQVLGEDNFNYFTREYIYKTPSSSPNIDEYGICFNEYLGNRTELEEIGYLKYIALLDLYWFNAYDNMQSSIQLPRGILSLWGGLKNELDISNIEIDEEISEQITLVTQENEIHLVAKQFQER
jgi:hypothetical protein